jgi:type II secretory pathway pseudopilin PulG
MKLAGSRHFPKSGEQGFALVATLSMMVLLVVLALGMMSLSTITLRTAGRDKAALRAQSNARLALQLAIGRLQELAGPDNRVTASSSIAGDEVQQKHLTGVWEGWKWDGQGSAPDWEEEKSSRFKGWLVSTNNDAARIEETFPDELPEGDTVALLGGARDQADRVDAQIVSLANSRVSRGRSSTNRRRRVFPFPPNHPPPHTRPSWNGSPPLMSWDSMPSKHSIGKP